MLRKRGAKKPALCMSALLLAIAFAVTGCGSSEDTTTASQEETTQEETVQEEVAEEPQEEVAQEEVQEEPAELEVPYFQDNVFETEEFKIEITDWRVIPVGEEGNQYGDGPVIAFWYNTTNLSDEPIDPSTTWIFHFTAIQDNDPNMVNELDIASLPDPQYRDTQMADIKPGGTVPMAEAYELSDEVTPVTLQAKANMFDSEPTGEMTFDIAAQG